MASGAGLGAAVNQKILHDFLLRMQPSVCTAVVADGAFAAIMPNIAKHFIHAQVEHFDLA